VDPEMLDAIGKLAMEIAGAITVVVIVVAVWWRRRD
jgi:hypothetical protein